MADNTVPITAGSGTNIRTVTNSGADGGAHTQVVALAGPDGAFLPQDPDETIQVSGDAKALYFDAFDSGTVTAYSVASANSGTTPSAASGAATLSSNTAASGLSYLRTNLTFTLRPQAYLRMGTFVQIETGAVANNTRWWGYGANQSTPSAAAPVLNGAVFVLDYAAGAMYAAVYSAGTRTQQVAITRPSDGAWHKYEVWFRQAIVYYLIDGVTVASISLPNLAQTSGMYLIAGSANYTTAPTASPVLKVSSLSMADTSGTVNTLGDGINPTTQATVKAASTAIATTDFPLAVGLHPSSPLPAGSNTIGTVNLATGLQGLPTLTVGSASTNASAIKASAASLMEVTFTNTSSTVVYVNFYNKTTTPVPGTDVPIYILACPATATTSATFPPIGKRFATGLGVSTTTAYYGTTGSTITTGSVLDLTYL